MTTTDTIKQADFIQRLYVDKASSGLKEFMDLRGGNTQKWRKYIESNKEDLAKKRPQILSVLDQESEILKKVALFKRYYPDFRDGDIYFCVGIGNSGGTIRDHTVYIGTEVAASARPNWSVYLVLHEFTHTQQYDQRNFAKLTGDTTLMKKYEATHKNLLGPCLMEGMADFVAELLLGQRLDQLTPDGYIAFGLKHEQQIWTEFKEEMNQEFNGDRGWLYKVRKIDGESSRDLGYFVGYQICKSYYEKARNKKKALNHMIGLNLADENAEKFLHDSGYDGPKR
ncbi:hypothetical protein GCM10027423_21410 [Spirosoma arcticum]